jgi:hypothetical protein
LLANGLDQMTLPHAALPNDDQILFAADEVGPGQRLDLQPIDGTGIEQPIEVGQGLAFRETRIAKTVGDASLAALVGLLTQECPQEFQVRHPFSLGAGQHAVELVGPQWDAQRLEVVNDLLSQIPL